MMSVWTLKCAQAQKALVILASGRVNANLDAVSLICAPIQALVKVKFPEDPALLTWTASSSTVVDQMAPALRLTIVKAVSARRASQTQHAAVLKTPAF